MLSLDQDYRRFTDSLLGPRDTMADEPFSSARQLTLGYSADPKFWLHYAVVCIDKKHFREASLALDRMERLAEAQRWGSQMPPGRVGVDAFRFLRLKYQNEMLKVEALGNPDILPHLHSSINRAAGLSLHSIKRELASIQSEEQASTRADRRVGAGLSVHLGRLKEVLDPLDHTPALDLAHSCMFQGRYLEADRTLANPGPGKSDEGDAGWYRLLLDWLIPFLQDPLRHLAPFTDSGDRYVVPMVVWGDAYLDTLERITLRSLLAEGNLPYLRERGETRVLFFTTGAGRARLQHSPVFQELARTVTAEFVVFPDELPNHRNPYRLMTAMHLAGLEIARASRSHFLFVAPDLVFSDNFLRSVDQRMRQGADVVFVPGLILELEGFIKAQARRFPAAPHALTIPPRELLELGMRHVHPFVRRAYTFKPNGRRSTVAVFLWPMAGGGYVVHGFHHTPFLISARAVNRFDGSMFTQIDGDLLPRIIRSRAELDRCVLLTDPTEANFFELSGRQRFGYATGSDLGGFDGGEFDTGHLCRFGALLGWIAQWLLPQKICFDPTGTGSHDSAVAESGRVIEEMVKGMERVEQDSSYLPVGIPRRQETGEPDRA